MPAQRLGRVGQHLDRALFRLSPELAGLLRLFALLGDSGEAGQRLDPNQRRQRGIRAVAQDGEEVLPGLVVMTQGEVAAPEPMQHVPPAGLVAHLTQPRQVLLADPNGLIVPGQAVVNAQQSIIAQSAVGPLGGRGRRAEEAFGLQQVGSVVGLLRLPHGLCNGRLGGKGAPRPRTSSSASASVRA